MPGGLAPTRGKVCRRFLFLAAVRLVSVAVLGGPPFLADVPPPLLAIRPGNQYAVAPNGQQFLVPRPIAEPSSDTLQVVLNWGEEIRR